MNARPNTRARRAAKLPGRWVREDFVIGEAAHDDQPATRDKWDLRRIRDMPHGAPSGRATSTTAASGLPFALIVRAILLAAGRGTRLQAADQTRLTNEQTAAAAAGAKAA